MRRKKDIKLLPNKRKNRHDLLKVLRNKYKEKKEYSRRNNRYKKYCAIKCKNTWDFPPKIIFKCTKEKKKDFPGKYNPKNKYFLSLDAFKIIKQTKR